LESSLLKENKTDFQIGKQSKAKRCKNIGGFLLQSRNAHFHQPSTDQELRKRIHLNFQKFKRTKGKRLLKFPRKEHLLCRGKCTAILYISHASIDLEFASQPWTPWCEMMSIQIFFEDYFILTNETP
jgi:hypothetical protein